MKVGESAGTLDEAFAGAARSLDEQATQRAQRVAKIVPVVAYLLVALLVAWVVITGYARLAALPQTLDL